MAQEPGPEIAGGYYRAAFAAVLTGIESSGKSLALPAEPLPEQSDVRRLRRTLGSGNGRVSQTHAGGHSNRVCLPIYRARESAMIRMIPFTDLPPRIIPKLVLVNPLDLAAGPPVAQRRADPQQNHEDSLTQVLV